MVSSTEVAPRGLGGHPLGDNLADSPEGAEAFPTTAVDRVATQEDGASTIG